MKYTTQDAKVKARIVNQLRENEKELEILKNSNVIVISKLQNKLIESDKVIAEMVRERATMQTNVNSIIKKIASENIEYKKQIAKLKEQLAAQEVRKAEHVAYSENGVLQWMSGRKFANCELYTAPPAPAPLVTATTLSAIQDALNAGQDAFGGDHLKIVDSPATRKAIADAIQAMRVLDEKYLKGAPVAAPTNATAIVQVALEATIAVIEGGNFLHNESPEARNAQALASRIRAIDKQTIIDAAMRGQQ